MAEDTRPSTSSGGPAGVETPGSVTMCFDVDAVIPVSVSTGVGGEAETAGLSPSTAAQGSLTSTQPTPSGSGYQNDSSTLDKRKVPCTKCSNKTKKLKSLRKKYSRSTEEI